MIPAPLFSLPMLLLLFAPVIAGLLTLWLVVRGLLWWQKCLRTPAPRPRFWTYPVIVWAVLAVAGDTWGLVLGYQFWLIDERVEQENEYRQSRQKFILPQDFQYGEQLFPKGTLINRYDAHDNGEPQRPLGLRGLSAARFPAPVQIAGVWVSAIDTSGELELSRDQRVAPVFHVNPNVDPPYGAWMVDPDRPYLDCRAGDIVRYHTPLIDYDNQAEFTTGAPDGPQARFRPSQWGFVRCISGRPPITVQPPY